MLNAQKENGIVYSEHEAINKTKAMWNALVKSDKDTYISFFADSVWIGSNGEYHRMVKKDLGEVINWWKSFENLTIQDDKPAFPDAIDYKNGGLWVQDWLLWKGVHKTTGINLKLHIHYLYRFDKNGKITVLNYYYNNDIFETIEKSQKTIENGVIYKYHPFINNTRKAVNAWAAKDMETWLSFYTPDAVFGSLSLKDGETIDLKTKKADTQKTFADLKTIELVQSGEPVCVAYEKEYFVVYSWWVLSITANDGIKKSSIPVMLTHGYDNKGKIKWEAVYMDSKRLE
jgi:ketosteroid isomerase-like protein